MEDGGFLDWQFNSISMVELLRDQICKGIILGYDLENMSTGPAILVVAKVGDSMERIGFGWID